jgi:hypothetical protein
MKSSLSLSIGGISLSFWIDLDRFGGILQERYKYFFTGRSADYEIEVDVQPPEFFHEFRVPDTDTPSVLISKANGIYTLMRKDNPFYGLYNERLRTVQVSMRESPYCFDGFLRVFLMILLANKGGLLFHSCSVDDYGQGRIFFGPSESGKTTVARLSGERMVLSDEMSIIRPRHGTYFVYGTPFWGEFQAGKNNHNVELKAMYSLRKSTINTVVPLDKVTSVNSLHRCVLYFGNVPELSRHILDTCVDLSQKIPVFCLNFTKDDIFWDVINKGYANVSDEYSQCIKK